MRFKAVSEEVDGVWESGTAWFVRDTKIDSDVAGGYFWFAAKLHAQIVALWFNLTRR